MPRITKDIEEIVQSILDKMGEKETETLLLDVLGKKTPMGTPGKHSSVRLNVAEALLDLGDALSKGGLKKDAQLLERASAILVKVAKNELMEEVEKAKKDTAKAYGDQSQDSLYKYKATSKKQAEKFAAIKDKLARAEKLQKEAEADAKELLKPQEKELTDFVASPGAATTPEGGKEGEDIKIVKSAALDKAYETAFGKK